MILDALKYIVGLGSETVKPELVYSDPRGRLYLIGGELKEVELPPPPRQHEVGSLADLISYANAFAIKPVGDANSGGIVVWYDEDEVVAMLDDKVWRADTATLSLHQSDAFLALVGLRDAKPWHDQKSFVRLLRVKLAGTLESGILLDRVRKVRFENGVAVQGEIQRNRESLGREITSQVSAAAKIPEEVTLSVRVYKTSGETDRHPIRCAVEVDPQAMTFQLIPLPDEIERVQQIAVADIAARLDEGLDKGIPHYYGKP